jgi:hypothetical protein
MEPDQRISERPVPDRRLCAKPRTTHQLLDRPRPASALIHRDAKCAGTGSHGQYRLSTPASSPEKARETCFRFRRPATMSSSPAGAF